MSKEPNSHNSEPADQQAFLRVFLANEREILRYVLALVPNIEDAQEIVQQTAVLLWEKFDGYDPDRPFAAWGCRFALNVTKQWIARRHRWMTLLDQGLAEQLVSRRDELRPDFDNRLSHLEHCLKKLPDDQRSLLDAYYFQQADVDGLARKTQRTVDAIYKSLQRIRRQLRRCIERSLGKEGIT